MLMLAFVLTALLYGGQPQPLTIVDESGTAVSNANVVFFDAAGDRDAEHTDGAGHVAAHSGFEPLRVRISAHGYRTLTIVLTPSLARIEMHRVLPVIANVSVATGSPQSLHRLPVAATVLDRASIAANASTTTDGLLRALPGFDRNRSNSAFTNYGQLRVSFAGAGNDRGLVLVDGIPAQDGFGGQIDWLAYPPQTLSRAELLLGAGSALYGAGAVGGVLALDMAAPNSNASAAADGSIDLSAGSHALSSATISIRTPLGPRLTAAFSSHLQYMQYFDLPPHYRSANSSIARSQSSMAAARFRYAASKSSIFEFGALGAWDSQDEGRPNYEFSRRLVQQDLRYLHPTAQSLTTVSYYGRSAFVTNIADQFPAKPGVLRYTQYVPSTESGVLLSWLVGNQRATFEARADERWVRGLSGRQRLGGLALQETIQNKRWEIVAGARADAVTFSRTDNAVSPRLAARYDLSPELAIRASHGSGFRAPFLNELVRGYFIGNVDFEPNPLLVPERSQTTSAGFDWYERTRRISADVFDTRVNDAIAFRTIDATHQMRSNLEHAQTDGATLTLTQALGGCSRVSVSATRQNARVTGDVPAVTGKRLAYVPDASGTLAVDGAIGRIAAGMTLSYLGQTYADDLNTQPLGTAVLLGARIRIPLNARAALTISADNLTDAHYLSSIDRFGPPSTISAGLSAPLGPVHPSAGGCSL